MVFDQNVMLMVAPLLLLLAGLAFTVMIDPYLQKIHRTILLVIIGMIMFRAGSLEEFANYLWGIVSRVNYGELTGGVLLCLGTDTPDFIVIGAGAVMMLIVGIMKERGTDVLQTVAKTYCLKRFDGGGATLCGIVFFIVQHLIDFSKMN